MSGKKLRMKDVLARLDDARRLSTEEYLEYLHGIRKNCVLQMFQNSYQGIFDDLQTLANCIDKVHWLIDSCEKKEISTGTGISITFDLPPESEQVSA